MPEIVIPEFVDSDALRALEQDYSVHQESTLWQRPADLAAKLKRARALIVRNRTQVTAQILEAAPKLEVIGRLGVGLDNIDVEAAKARGVAVCPATGGNTVSVVEYVIAAALILLRAGAYSANDAVLAGEWPREKLMGREVEGRTIGLIGFGAIGQAVAARASAIGLRVIACDAYRPASDPAWMLVEGGRLDMQDVLRNTDIVTIHVPLDKSTRYLIDKRAIAAMRKGAILINSARGGIVEEEALVAALKGGHLGGAALDVFEVEPLTVEAAARFKGAPNLLLTPHIAGVTHEANARVSAITADNVRRVLEGKS